MPTWLGGARESLPVFGATSEPLSEIALSVGLSDTRICAGCSGEPLQSPSTWRRERKILEQSVVGENLARIKQQIQRDILAKPKAGDRVIVALTRPFVSGQKCRCDMQRPSRALPQRSQSTPLRLELNAGCIHLMNTDGSDHTTIVTGYHLPDGIVVDVEAGHIYWTNMASKPERRVRRAADIDGKNRKTVIAKGDTHTPKQIVSIRRAASLLVRPRGHARHALQSRRSQLET